VCVLFLLVFCRWPCFCCVRCLIFFMMFLLLLFVFRYGLVVDGVWWSYWLSRWCVSVVWRCWFCSVLVIWIFLCVLLSLFLIVVWLLFMGCWCCSVFLMFFGMVGLICISVCCLFGVGWFLCSMRSWLVIW